MSQSFDGNTSPVGQIPDPCSSSTSRPSHQDPNLDEKLEKECGYQPKRNESSRDGGGEDAKFACAGQPQETHSFLTPFCPR